jgi:hypothetical protein
MINITITIYEPSIQYNKTYYGMTATSKRSLISESIVAIQISVHHVGEEPNQHVVCMAHMSHVRQPFTKSLLGQNRAPAPGMKSWLPGIIWPGCHPGLPHSPSNKPPRSREVQFDKLVNKLLRLLGPIKHDMRSVQIKACPSGPK